MAHHASGWIRRLVIQAAASASALSRRAALLAVGTAFVVFLWIVAVAPALVPCALAAALAIAWCVWLEEQADHRADDELRASVHVDDRLGVSATRSTPVMRRRGRR